MLAEVANEATREVRGGDGLTLRGNRIGGPVPPPGGPWFTNRGWRDGVAAESVAGGSCVVGVFIIINICVNGDRLDLDWECIDTLVDVVLLKLHYDGIDVIIGHLNYFLETGIILFNYGHFTIAQDDNELHCDPKLN